MVAMVPLLLILAAYGRCGRNPRERRSCWRRCSRCWWRGTWRRLFRPGASRAIALFRGVISAVVAAGGLEAFLKQRPTSGAALWTGVLALTGAQAVALAILAHTVVERARPFGAVRREASGLRDQMVFLTPSERFTAFHFNVDRADWEQAAWFSSIPGPERRDDVAREFGFSRWTAIGVDARGAARVVASRGGFICGINGGLVDCRGRQFGGAFCAGEAVWTGSFSRPEKPAGEPARRHECRPHRD